VSRELIAVQHQISIELATMERRASSPALANAIGGE